jgi:hypothetical protein
MIRRGDGDLTGVPMKKMEWKVIKYGRDLEESQKVFKGKNF